MKVRIQDFFEAQHQLPDTEFLVTKACNNYHGHTYKVIVDFEGSDQRGGMIIDFKGIKQLIATLDHTGIYQRGNPIIDFIKQVKSTQSLIILEDPPSSENIAKHIYQIIDKEYSSWGLTKLSVSVCEGYKGEERASWTTYTTKDFVNDLNA